MVWPALPRSCRNTCTGLSYSHERNCAAWMRRGGSQRQVAQAFAKSDHVQFPSFSWRAAQAKPQLGDDWRSLVRLAETGGCTSGLMRSGRGGLSHQWSGINTTPLLQLAMFVPLASGKGSNLWKHHTFLRGSLGLPTAVLATTQNTVCTSARCLQDTNPEASTNAQVTFRLNPFLKLKTGSYLSNNEVACLLGIHDWPEVVLHRSPQHPKYLSTHQRCWGSSMVTPASSSWYTGLGCGAGWRDLHSPPLPSQTHRHSSKLIPDPVWV